MAEKKRAFLKKGRVRGGKMGVFWVGYWTLFGHTEVPCATWRTAAGKLTMANWLRTREEM